MALERHWFDGRYLVNTSANKVFFRTENNRDELLICDSATGGSQRPMIIECRGYVLVNEGVTFGNTRVGDFEKFTVKVI